MGLGRFPSDVCGTEQIFFRSRWDWAELVQEWVGLGRISSGVGGIGQISFRSGED